MTIGEQALRYNAGENFPSFFIEDCKKKKKKKFVAEILNVECNIVTSKAYQRKVRNREREIRKQMKKEERQREERNREKSEMQRE